MAKKAPAPHVARTPRAAQIASPRHTWTIEGAVLLIAPLIAEGCTFREIGKRLNVDDTAISRWAKRPEVVARVAEIHGEVRDRTVALLADRAFMAASAIVDLAEGRPGPDGEPIPPEVRLRAANSLLNRSGFAEATKSEVKVSGSVSLGLPDLSALPPDEAARLAQHAIAQDADPVAYSESSSSG